MSKEWTIQVTPEQARREQHIIIQKIPPEFQEVYMRSLGQELIELVSFQGASTEST